ncbi:MAG: SAM-dependent methyltransferase [Ruminococcaceae bacterium]|nr:SAM-dependent methyltransferase [Oscillospiraceae bacterium]
MNAYGELASLCLLAARTETLKKLVFSRPVDGDITKASGVLCRVGGKIVLQIETLHSDHKATHENLPIDRNTENLLAARFPRFSQINLLTTGGDCELRRTKKGAELLLGADKLRRRLSDTADTEVVEIGGNDKEKKRILSGSEPFLALLGVADKNGRIYDKKQAKFRQINRFLELIADILPSLPEGRIRILDLCCGKSYLSFAVYHYFANVLHREVSMTGVDLKADVIDYCQDVAEKLGFDGLEFLWGNVARFETEDKPDLVISLHACDTATDLVLERAVTFDAKVILATPCCHHELNHTLNCPTLDFIGRHSMLRQKFCDAATDALRLLWLEAHGYSVAALELIDPDDTPKNIMLRAIRRANPDAAAQELALAEYRATRRFLLGEEPQE